jgi:4-hydroxybenzoate polyprenyltransferase
MKAIWELLRLKNLSFLALALVGLALLCAPDIHDEAFRIPYFGVALLFIYTICSVAASGYVINDVFDMETDQINKPEKLIVGRLISVRFALWIYFALLLEGLLFGWLFQWLTGNVFFVLLVFTVQLSLFLYAKYLKKSTFLGNLLVAFLAAFPYILFTLIFGIQGFHFQVVFWVFVFAFVLNLLREIVKDWQDMSGDKVIQARTIPIVLGIPTTTVILRVLLLVSMLLHVFLPVYFSLKEDVLLTDFLVAFWPVFTVAAMHVPLLLKISKWTPQKSSFYLKMMMFVGVLWIYYWAFFIVL